jgi:hypothetical protein
VERDLMTWLLKLVLPRGDRDAVLGDLIEERALHANPHRWYRQQVLRSVRSIVWANIRRGVWLKTVGVVLASYAVIVVLVVLTQSIRTEFSLAAGSFAGLAGGYVAAWMRPTAPRALAIFVFFMGVVSLFLTGDQAPLWYQLGLIVIGPAAVIAGGKLRRRWA